MNFFKLRLDNSYVTKCSTTCSTSGEVYPGFMQNESSEVLTDCEPENKCNFPTNHRNEASLLDMRFKVKLKKQCCT